VHSINAALFGSVGSARTRRAVGSAGPTSGSRLSSYLIRRRLLRRAWATACYSSSEAGSCRGMSSDGNSSGVGSVGGGTGVLFSVRRPRRIGALRATFFRAAVLRLVVMRVVALRPAALLRTADLRPVVFRAVVLPVAVFRAAVLRTPVLRPALLRAALLRTADLRTGGLRAADLRRADFGAAVLRGRPGLRLLAMTPSVKLVDDVRRWISHFSCHANRPRPLPRGSNARTSGSHTAMRSTSPCSIRMGSPVRIKAAGAMFAVRGRRTS
jgi:hypothetical protein